MAMTPLTPTTELEAVNIMLGTIGETPITSLAVSGVNDASIAISVLREVCRRTQMVGWQFNTERQWEISPDVNGNLNLPANTLKVDAEAEFAVKYDLVQRGTKLYDRKGHTLVFTEPVKVELVVFLEFTDLPEAARNFITISAARTLQKRLLGSETLDGFTQDQETRAWMELRDAHADTGDYNMLSDSWSVAQILQR